jgi:antitoxin component YwqK of YwqJK toxin-antitoxin module
LFPLVRTISLGLLFLAGLGLLGAKEAAAQRHDPPSDSLNQVDSEGRKQGVWRYYFSTGELKQETIYKDGEKYGLDLTFHRWPNCIKTEAQYKNDTLYGSRIVYHRNCNVKLMESYVAGIRDGYVRQYDKSGFLESEGFYKKGKLDGTIKTFTKDETEPANTDPESKVDLEPFLIGDIPIRDSVILRGLIGIKPDKNTLIAADVTGSMYPYIGQLLLWYQMNIEHGRVENFVFFNDGDEKPDLTKKVGKVGGVYPIKTDDIVTLKNKMEEAISKGNGGDMQENDIEGILEGLKQFRKTTKVILVADRKSPVRDISLLKKIDVPVYVLLCGTPDFTHIHYLNMAYKTGGSVYSLGEEWIELKDIEEGQRLRIAHLTYQFKSGHFVRLRE